VSEAEDKIDKRFYGRIQGRKLHPTRKKLVDEFLPKLEINLPEKPFSEDELKSLFGINPKEIWLEVGFGGGEHLAEQSYNNQDVAIIGSEVFVNGVASLLAHIAGAHEDGNVVIKHGVSIAEGRSDNVRIYPNDVRKLLDLMPEACLNRVFVLFPDPWPKKRHAERRFIGSANLPILAKLLKKGGELRVASDDMTYIRWALQHLSESADFEWLAEESKDWLRQPSDWVNTRYEQKAIREGRKPIYLRYKRT